MRPLFFGTAIQIAYFIQMKGTGVCRFCFRRLLRVRSLRYLLFVQDAAKGALFPSFAVIVFAWVRFRAFARLCGFFAASFVLPPFGYSTRGGAKMEEQQGDKPPASVVRFIGCGVLPRPASISLQ